jgi:thioredoxin 1
MLELTDQDFQAETEGRLTIVDLWAPWCGPCRAFAPIFEAVAAEHGDEILFAKCNVDENPATARRLDVQGVPTLLVLGPDGNQITRVVGTVSCSQFERVVGDAVSAAA